MPGTIDESSSNDPLDVLRSICAGSLAPGRWFAARDVQLQVQYRGSVTMPWEVYRGRLLDQTQTRETAAFETWDLCYADPQLADCPALVSLLLDVELGEVQITRQLHIHGYQAVEVSPGVIETRPIRRWQRELVGTIELQSVDGLEQLESLLARYVQLAVRGTSRLPTASLENPLLQYALGRLDYLPRPAETQRDGGEPIRDPGELLASRLSPELTTVQQAKLIETALRAAQFDEVAALAEIVCRRLSGEAVALALRTMFNQVALSPNLRYLDALDALLSQMARPERLGIRPAAEVAGYMLRQLVRHLTAYDLITFHNQGANYPDALLLDLLLRQLLALATAEPACFTAGDSSARLLRRALRQGWLTRKQYEGLKVPDAPSSSGEQQLVMPATLEKVPARQLSDPSARTKQLYLGAPTDALFAGAGQGVLDQAFADLARSSELRELGLALFQERPLGLKLAGEVDRTPLVSYVAHSRSVAIARLDRLRDWGAIDAAFHQQLSETIPDPGPGWPAAQVPAPPAAKVVSLEDAVRAAADFRLLRSTRGSLDHLLSGYDWTPLAKRDPHLVEWLLQSPDVLVVRHGDDPQTQRLRFLDRDLRCRLECSFGPRGELPPEYLQFAGEEFLAAGLQALAISAAENVAELVPLDPAIGIMPQQGQSQGMQ